MKRQRWEYCEVSATFADGSAKAKVKLHFYTPTETQEQAWESETGNHEVDHDLAARIARLGLRGWEMVGFWYGLPFGSRKYIFKRPLDDDEELARELFDQ